MKQELVHRLQILSVFFLMACTDERVRKVACPPKDGLFCGEYHEKYLDGRWVLDGWHINRFDSNAVTYSAFRSGDLVYRDGPSVHGGWVVAGKAKSFKIEATFPKGNEIASFVIRNKELPEAYQVVLNHEKFEYLFSIKSEGRGSVDTLYRSPQIN